MRLQWLDEYYPDALAQLTIDRVATTYAESNAHLLGKRFGTSNFWDLALRRAGHESETIVANDSRAQEMYAREHDLVASAGNVWISQLDNADADVVCVQNVGIWTGPKMRSLFLKAKLVAFCSYATEIENLRGFDVVFTSFQWFADELRVAGINAEYMPLAFGVDVLDELEHAERDLDCIFIGGLGYRIWMKGTSDFTRLCDKSSPDYRDDIDFKWWGYVVGHIEIPLVLKFQGPAWGMAAYRLLSRAKIVINRHGEIARSVANNMRCYEATGCGALLLNDCEVPHGHFMDVVYRSGDLADKIQELLTNDDERRSLADDGQKMTLAHHTYDHRVPQLLEAISKIGNENSKAGTSGREVGSGNVAACGNGVDGAPEPAV